MFVNRLNFWSIRSGWNLLLVSAVVGALMYTLGAETGVSWFGLLASGQGLLIALFTFFAASASSDRHRHTDLAEFLAICSTAAAAAGSVGVLYSLGV